MERRQKETAETMEQAATRLLGRLLRRANSKADLSSAQILKFKIPDRAAIMDGRMKARTARGANQSRPGLRHMGVQRGEGEN